MTFILSYIVCYIRKKFYKYNFYTISTLIYQFFIIALFFPFYILYIKPISNDLLQDNHESECFLGHHESLPYLIFVLSAILTILVFTYVAYGRICYKAMRSQRHAKNNVQRCTVSLVNLKKKVHLGLSINDVTCLGG